jgi:hypothetical protein
VVATGVSVATARNPTLRVLIGLDGSVLAGHSRAARLSLTMSEADASTTTR